LNFIVSLAFKNLRRNLRRTVISGIAVIAGVALMILGNGLIGGLDEGVIRGQIDTQVGHVSLYPPDHPTNGLDNPVDELVELPAGLDSLLAEYTYTTRLRFDTRIVHGVNGMRVVGIGYNPNTDPDVFLRDDFEVDGAWPEESDQVGVVLGKTLASLLDVEVGGIVTMQNRTSMGSQNALSWPVVGILNAQNPLLDSKVAFLTIDQAMELVVAPGPSQVAVRLNRRGETEEFLEVITSADEVGDWQAVSYIDGAEDMLAINKIRRSALKVMIFVLMAIAATGIANTVIMAVYERIREVGTLAAMGMRPKEIRKLFLIEGAVMGFSAALVGALLGGLANYRLSTTGFSVGDLPDAGAIPISTTIYTTFGWGPIWMGLIFGVIVATLASVWPAKFAAGLDPAVAVRDD